jgi:5-(carboxyamino)imidazole ribonucleotide synthase
MTQKTNIFKANSTIGILGGGQLGQMLCHAANKMGYRTVVFSDVAACPASFATNQTIIADYLDQNALQEFCSKIDVATFEFENIPVAAVNFIAQNRPIYPGANVLKITQNRLEEKSFARSIGIDTTDYLPIKSLADLQNGLAEFDFRAILKTATMGYDGKGQKVLNKESNLTEIWAEFDKKDEKPQLILEKFANFSSEISVIVAKSVNGEIACYEPLTNIHKGGILHKSIYPAQIDPQIAQKAQEIGQKIAQNLDLIGLLAIEFFVMPDGNLLLNEMAPRPHNSGHFSMDGAITGQFEQCVRAILGLPLGSTKFHSTGFMQNLIGDDVLKADEFLRNKNAKLHLYGKEKVAKGRKMGHVNFVE